MSTAHILDRGYRPYEGPRSGLPGAMGSLIWHSLRATLGLGRAARHKIFPAIAIVIAYLPAIVFAGLAAFIDIDLILEGILPSYAAYYGYIGTAIILFSALVTPDILVADRRNGLLWLYMSTPLTRWSYLVSKSLAVLSALALVTLGPPLLLLLAYTFEGSGPDGFGSWLAILARMVFSGLVVSAGFGAVALAASCLTERRAFASIAVILLFIASPVVTAGLVEAAGLSEQIYLFDISTIPFDLVIRIYGETGGRDALSTAALAGAVAAVVVLAAAVVELRYRRLIER